MVKCVTAESIVATLTVLERTPVRLRASFEALADDELASAGNKNDWSASDVLAHLRACADVWGGYIERILNEDVPAFRAVSPRSRMRRSCYADVPFRDSLAAFAAQRTKLIATLQPLPRDAWERHANVTKSGRIQRLTVLNFAEMLANHEQDHWVQLDEITRPLGT